MKICVIGVGKWGINHVKTLKTLKSLGGVVDSNPAQIDKIKKLFPNTPCFNLLENSFQSKFDGYIVSTPPLTHLDIIKKLILNNKPILVEKPLTLSVSSAKEIQSIIKKSNVKLMVGHLLLFHPAILKIKEMIDDGVIGDLQYMYSNRLKLGVVRKDENVLWSFAPHDISLFQFFINSFPIKVKSSGAAFLQKKIEDTMITYLKYPNGVEGHIFVNWLHPYKEHKLVLIGSKGSLSFEDSVQTQSLFYYEKVSEFNPEVLLENKPAKEIIYEQSSPLTNELNYFIDVINGKKVKKASLKEGIDVVKILNMSRNS